MQQEAFQHHYVIELLVTQSLMIVKCWQVDKDYTNMINDWLIGGGNYSLFIYVILICLAINMCFVEYDAVLIDKEREMFKIRYYPKNVSLARYTSTL